jgi:hypothetical protein
MLLIQNLKRRRILFAILHVIILHLLIKSIFGVHFLAPETVDTFLHQYDQTSTILSMPPAPLEGPEHE